MGITDTDALRMAASENGTSATLYVSVGSSKLLKVTTRDTTVTYSNFGTTKLPSEPKAEVQYDDYIKQVSIQTGTSQNVNAEAKDVERKSDIDSLAANVEAYAVNNGGQYPTAAQMQDANWIAKNIPDLDPSALKDPEGTSSQLVSTPTTHQYSYQAKDGNGAVGCDNTATSCLNYQITAILSDGTEYTQKSL